MAMRGKALALAAGALLLALGGCGEKPPEPAQDTAVLAGPDDPPGITLSDARVQLPAVSGRPGAAYLTVSQASGAPRAIAGVEVAMAGRTEMHETMKEGAASTMKPLASVPLESGKSVEFAPGGRHVMLFDLDPKLRFQDATEITVTFDNGDKASTKAKVTTVNEMEDMD